MKAWFRPFIIAPIIILIYMIVLAIITENPLVWFTLSERRAPEELQEFGYSPEGYDGESVYLIARDPESAMYYIDRGAYRYQRILFPALGRILAFGNPHLLILTLPLISLLSVAIGTYALELLIRQHDLSSWYAAGYSFSLGILGAARLTTTEPLAYGLAIIGIFFANQKKWVPGAVAFSLGILAKETTIFFPAGYGFYLLHQRNWRQAIPFGIITLAPFVFWQAILYGWFGSLGVGSGGALATSFEIIPFWGYLHIWFGGNFQAFLFISSIVFPFVILPTLWGFWRCWYDFRNRTWSAETQILFFNILIMPTIPFSTYSEFLGILRFIVGLQISVIWYSAARGLRRPLVYSTLWSISSFLVIGSDYLR